MLADVVVPSGFDVHVECGGELARDLGEGSWLLLLLLLLLSGCERRRRRLGSSSWW